MKTASTTSENFNAAPRFKFNQKINSIEDSASLKAWEKENAEYATWNLIDDEQETETCSSGKASKGAFFWSFPDHQTNNYFY